MRLMLLCFSVATVMSASSENVQDIVRRSVAANETNWKRAPEFGHVERDVTSKAGGPKSVKTYQVYLIQGSEYNQLLAVNDKPLPPKQKAEEDQKLQREIQKRLHESPSERSKRIAKYEHERQQDHAMMREMADAFTFRIAGEENVNGRPAWVLAAEPKPGYRPKMRDTKVLTGMRGTMWIDKQSYQWAKVDAQVVKPVTFGGFIAEVGPGTRFVLEQSPVGGSLWLPTHFAANVNASVLWRNKSSTDDETYRDYRPMREILPPLAARK